MRASRTLVTLLILAIVLLPAPASACIVNVTCPWYVTPIYWWGVDLIMQGYTPIQLVQIGTQNIGWIQASLGISEGEAVFAIAAVHSILEPWFIQIHTPPSPGASEGGYSGDEGTN